MLNKRIAVTVLVACMVWWVSASLAQAGKPQVYNNQRFGYHLVVPEGFELQRRADNGDGCIYQNRALNSELRCWASHNALEQTLYELAKLDATKPGSLVTMGDNWYLVQYRDEKGRLCYLHRTVGPNYLYGFSLTFASATPAQAQELLTRVKRSFCPGQL